nr:MAG TPA: hypothetical protein [Caudoviricetes sp.]
MPPQCLTYPLFISLQPHLSGVLRQAFWHISYFSHSLQHQPLLDLSHFDILKRHSYLRLCVIIITFLFPPQPAAPLTMKLPAYTSPGSAPRACLYIYRARLCCCPLAGIFTYIFLLLCFRPTIVFNVFYLIVFVAVCCLHIFTTYHSSF